MFTEKDNNDSVTAKSDPYGYSKVMSEKIVAEYVTQLSPEASFSYVFVNPGAIYGPILNDTQVCWW